MTPRVWLPSEMSKARVELAIRKLMDCLTEEQGSVLVNLQGSLEVEEVKKAFKFWDSGWVVDAQKSLGSNSNFWLLSAKPKVVELEPYPPDPPLPDPKTVCHTCGHPASEHDDTQDGFDHTNPQPGEGICRHPGDDEYGRCGCSPGPEDWF